MLVIAVMPWVMLGWSSHEWKALIGGTAFLLIPQIVGWFLFVGLFTGRIPTRGGSELRSMSPIWFWAVAATYGALLLLYAWITCSVGADIWVHGLY
jgi:hypothetical protein